MKKRLAIGASLVLVMAGLGVGLRVWHAQALTRSENRRRQQIEQALQHHQPDDALRLLSQRRIPEDEPPQTTLGWLSLEVGALEQIIPARVPRLLAIYDRWPDAFGGHEKASVVIARALLEAGDLDRFQQFRQRWKGSETDSLPWFWLDVDKSVLSGQEDQALDLLRQKQFSGPADAERLGRLGLIELEKNPAQAKADLNRACSIAPENPNLRTIRARVIEQLGDPAAARLDRIAAVLAEPANPFWRDQLGEFYLRYGKFDEALETFAGAARLPDTPGSVWLKTFFWNRVVAPVDISWNKPPASSSDLNPLLTYLGQLGPGIFWQESNYERIAEARRFEAQRQEVFWLRLLEDLRSRDETNALSLIQFNRFRHQSWNPPLESALARVLVFRSTGEFRFPLALVYRSDTRPRSERHPLLMELDEATRAVADGGAVPDGLASLLRSDEAFAALLIAAGWREAGLNLNRMTTWDGHAPEWLGYDLTKAIRLNRGNAAALQFLRDAAGSKRLQTLRAELLLGENRILEGVALLEPIAGEETETGWRAAWFLALAKLHQRDYDAARATLQKHPKECQSVAGKTLLARIAFEQGKTSEAEQLYSSMEKESPEAKAFLARQAFSKKDWTSAERLTKELISELPLDRRLYSTLAAIKKAEGK